MTTLYEWVALSAERTPNACAVEVAGESLTYADLCDCAMGVATTILATYGRSPKRVALLADRSVVAFAGYLAASRLGAAVVPLNPDHPVQRNQLICESVALDVLIADDNGAAQLEGLRHAASTIVRLRDSDALGTKPAKLPALNAMPGDVAYLLFTSGSTGKPKGVPITHGNVASYVARNIARFEVGPGARVSHAFDLTFDPSVFDLFVTWGAGATLVAPDRAALLTPVDYLADRALTHWLSVPSVVSVAANLGNLPTGRPTALRYGVFIGEQLTYTQAAAWRAIAPHAHIVNVYGPTELTVACTEYRLPQDPERWPPTSNNTVPIGPVYESLENVIIDENGTPSSEGELCVRGAQRFGGYLDPGDNVGRFLARDGDRYVPCDPGVPEPDHYYRTGDRVRWENGELVHLGRLDHQVKVRGFRVELGEIEAAIARHADITQAVVVTVPGKDAPELVAFYTGSQVSDRRLTRWLRDLVPIHMVPRHLYHLAELPLNANGKVDRNALRESVLSGTA